MRKNSRYGFPLLATTSIVAISLAAAPLAVGLHSPLPVLKVAMADSCCFTGDTLVRMADGSERPIRSIRPGDLVLGPGGGACRVVRIERPRLGARLLYRLNGGPAFVTAEHPFATLGGWRSIDPAATADETPRLPVRRLRIGDCLRTLSAHPVRAVHGNVALAAPKMTVVALMSLKAEPGAPETVLYNLLLDGEHAYFANGYLVHNKGDGSGSGGEGSGGDGSGGDGSGGGESGGGESGGGESGSNGSGNSGSQSGTSSESESPESPSGSGVSGSSNPSDSTFGDIQAIGPDLTPSEEAETISKGWQ